MVKKKSVSKENKVKTPRSKQTKDGSKKSIMVNVNQLGEPKNEKLKVQHQSQINLMKPSTGSSHNLTPRNVPVKIRKSSKNTVITKDQTKDKDKESKHLKTNSVARKLYLQHF